MNLRNEICNAFNKQALNYEKSAKIQLEIGERLFERLDYLKISPRFVLDLGCGTGVFTRLLRKKYPKAIVISLDFAANMLKETKKKQGFLRRWPLVQADMSKLPFKNASFDLIFANQTIHWSLSQLQLFKELNRILNVNGCLMFSTLGPDSFKELKQAWAAVDKYAHVNNFKDMHDLGDELLQARFLDPVVDMEYISLQYKSLAELVSGLHEQGVRNVNASRNKGLTGKSAWGNFSKNYAKLCTQEGKYPLTYEVVYGHAWKGELRAEGDAKEAFISLADIKVTRS